MEEFSNIKAYDLKDAKRIVGLKSTSYKDYLVARFLLNANFLHQGTILMNTCLEKCLKVYLLVNDEKIDAAKHDTLRLYNQLKKLSAKIASPLNQDFFKVISKVYKSRYYETLQPPYNFVIVRNQFLAELDFSFDYLDSLTRISMVRDKGEHVSNFERDKRDKLPGLIENNFLLNSISREDFLKQPEFYYEFRIAPNHEIIEVLYKTNATQKPLVFIHEGLKILPDNHSVVLSNGGNQRNKMKHD